MGDSNLLSPLLLTFKDNGGRIMAEKDFNKEEENKKSDGGHDNRLAYGLLIGAGINVNGLTPTQAWDLVSQLNLLESKKWKRTEEDKQDIKQKNLDFRKQGKDIKDIERKALNSTLKTKFDGVGNVYALNEAVETINNIKNSYKIDKLQIEAVKNLSSGAMASANDSVVNISTRLIRNPNASYRICVENFGENLKNNIDKLQSQINITNDYSKRIRLENRLNKLKSMQGCSRHNVIYKGEEVKSVITHEMGHVIAGQIFGFVSQTGASSSTNKKIIDCYNQSMANGDIKKVSGYAMDNADEFFAECFTVYQIGKEKLPKNIENMIEGVLKLWKR